ncbi:formimidoylglutamase [Winogradskyella echinorum]|uniref:Formimidoylglutamase n=1 Tax=Winogradskyella echinorum TaxID=538189 RepID=A0ABR6Y1B7_9FLAO|nr:formimidoylglutamase [Winogradskyella echinorum]MBC3846503.1 formimidoylglutamase [Winogradskyella echinorum]MBC5750851.1 formimidoylglutamase [Winogradskyella echinorum]
MQNLILFTSKNRDTLLKVRKGESKFGEHIQLIPKLTNIYDDIVNLDVDYVIFGIKEDIGVYANYGNTGTYKAWDAVIKVLLNIQNNSYSKAKRVLILGHLDYSKERELVTLKPSKKNITKARTFVASIDNDVTHVVSSIVNAGKIPIIIGGGHNNAYGNIKGTALAKNNKINVINFDAHTDFRPEEGRHSGNGFSYAFVEGFLKNYFVFGLHENYTSEVLFKTLNKLKEVKYNTYEAIEVRNELDFNSELETALTYISNKDFGIEIDCDAIENIPSSAMTPSGFRVKHARQLVHYFGKHKNASYLHICEAVPTKKTETKVGKLITYLITDFIRAHGN